MYYERKVEKEEKFLLFTRWYHDSMMISTIVSNRISSALILPVIVPELLK
jgi:hypothetical protein